MRAWVFGCLILLAGSSLLAKSPDGEPAQPLPDGRVQWMSEAKRKELRSLFPPVLDDELYALLLNPRLILYTEAELPPAYQEWDGALQGVHSVHYNISADNNEPYGNGNIEFPWGAPAGTHRAQSVSTFRFLWLPEDAEGRIQPVVWYRKRFRDDVSMGWGWTFPVGAVVGEVLLMKTPEGERLPFELRVRIRQKGDWGVNVYRPFPTAGHLAQRIKELRADWESHPELVAFMQHLETPRELERRLLEDAHPNRVFRQAMGVDELPPLEDAELVKQLLTETPFQSSLGQAWRVGTNGEFTVAPTTQAAFHVVPANYDGGFIDVDADSCMRCHETVNQHVRRFQFSRDWYGRVRGSDGIFSFHPFSRGSISHNGYGTGVSMRSELISAGVLEEYDPERHSKAVYNAVPRLVE